MSVIDAFDDARYRALVQQVLRTASDAVHVEVVSVDFAREGYRDGYAWLCVVVDPRAEDGVASITGSSAADHFALIDPNGFSRNAGTRVNCTVFELEIADEAPIQIRGDGGEPKLYSPWLAHLAVARALFNVGPAD